MYSVEVIVAVGAFPVDETDAARLHHVEEQPLFRDGMFAPHEQFQQRAGEAAGRLACQYTPVLLC